jgi:hypothetical protein
LKCSYGYFCKIESVQGFFLQGHLISSSQALCPFCDVETEHALPLFLHYHGSLKLWQRFMKWLGISWCMPKTVEQVVLQWLMAGLKEELLLCYPMETSM